MSVVVRLKRLVLSKKCRVAVCMGSVYNGKVSTREEWLDSSSIEDWKTADLILLHTILQHKNSANPDVLLLMGLHHRDNLTPVSNI